MTVATYLIGGRLRAGGGRDAGEITVRRLVPSSLTCELAVNQAESIDVTVSLPLRDPVTGTVTPLPEILIPGRDFLGVVVDDTLVAAGPISADPFAFPYSSRIIAAGLWSYFDRRLVLPVMEPGQLPRDVTSRWEGLSLRTIAKRLVQQANDHPLAGLPIDFEDDIAGDHEREYPGSDGTWVGEALRNLTRVEGGPEVAFRPYLTTDRRHVRWALVTGDPQISQPGDPHYWDTSVPTPHASMVSLERDGSGLASHSYLAGSTVKNLIRDGEFREGIGSWRAGGVNGTMIASAAGPSELALGALSYSISSWTGPGAGGAASGASYTVEAGQTWVVSMWAQGTAKPVRLLARFYDDAGMIAEQQLATGAVVWAGYTRLTGQAVVPAGASKMELLLYSQAGHEWASGDTLRTTKWCSHLDVGSPLPYFYDQIELQAASVSSALTDAGYPMVESWEARGSVLRPDTLAGYAEETVARGAAHTTVRPLRVRRDKHPKLGTYLPGDYARIRRGDTAREPAGTTTERILRVAFGVTGDVTVDVSPQRTAAGYPVPPSDRSWLSAQLAELGDRINETRRG